MHSTKFKQQTPNPVTVKVCAFRIEYRSEKREKNKLLHQQKISTLLVNDTRTRNKESRTIFFSIVYDTVQHGSKSYPQ